MKAQVLTAVASVATLAAASDGAFLLRFTNEHWPLDSARGVFLHANIPVNFNGRNLERFNGMQVTARETNWQELTHAGVNLRDSKDERWTWIEKKISSSDPSYQIEDLGFHVLVNRWSYKNATSGNPTRRVDGILAIGLRERGMVRAHPRAIPKKAADLVVNFKAVMPQPLKWLNIQGQWEPFFTIKDREYEAEFEHLWKTDKAGLPGAKPDIEDYELGKKKFPARKKKGEAKMEVESPKKEDEMVTEENGSEDTWIEGVFLCKKGGKSPDFFIAIHQAPNADCSWGRLVREDIKVVSDLAMQKLLRMNREVYPNDHHRRIPREGIPNSIAGGSNNGRTNFPQSMRPELDAMDEAEDLEVEKEKQIALMPPEEQQSQYAPGVLHQKNMDTYEKKSKAVKKAPKTRPLADNGGMMAGFDTQRYLQSLEAAGDRESLETLRRVRARIRQLENPPRGDRDQLNRNRDQTNSNFGISQSGVDYNNFNYDAPPDDLHMTVEDMGEFLEYGSLDPGRFYYDDIITPPLQRAKADKKKSPGEQEHQYPGIADAFSGGFHKIRDQQPKGKKDSKENERKPRKAPVGFEFPFQTTRVGQRLTEQDDSHPRSGLDDSAGSSDSGNPFARKSNKKTGGPLYNQFNDHMSQYMPKPHKYSAFADFLEYTKKQSQKTAESKLEAAPGTQLKKKKADPFGLNDYLDEPAPQVPLPKRNSNTDALGDFFSGQDRRPVDGIQNDADGVPFVIFDDSDVEAVDPRDDFYDFEIPPTRSSKNVRRRNNHGGRNGGRTAADQYLEAQRLAEEQQLREVLEASRLQNEHVVPEMTEEQMMEMAIRASLGQPFDDIPQRAPAARDLNARARRRLRRPQRDPNWSPPSGARNVIRIDTDLEDEILEDRAKPANGRKITKVEDSEGRTKIKPVERQNSGVGDGFADYAFGVDSNQKIPTQHLAGSTDDIKDDIPDSGGAANNQNIMEAENYLQPEVTESEEPEQMNVGNQQEERMEEERDGSYGSYFGGSVRDPYEDLTDNEDDFQ